MISFQRGFSRRSLFVVSLTVLMGTSSLLSAQSAWALGKNSKFAKRLAARKNQSQAQGQSHFGGQQGLKSDSAQDGTLPTADQNKRLGQVALYLDTPHAVVGLPVAQVIIEPGLHQDSKDVIVLASEIQSCGATLKGSACLDSQYRSANFMNERILVAESEHARILTPLAKEGKLTGQVVLTEMSYEHPHAIESMSIVSFGPKITLESLKHAYDHGKFERQIALVFPTQSAEFAQQKLKQGVPAKEAFHLCDYLLRTHPVDSVLVQEWLTLNYRIMTQSSLPVYQIALLKLAEEFAFSTEQIKLIADDLIESPHKEVAELAAILLAEKGIKTEPVKILVRQAMQAQGWKTRQRALYAFKKVREGAQDDQAFMDALSDTDTDVKEAARSAVAEIHLTNAHLDAVAGLMASTNWALRFHAVELLGRLETPESTRKLFQGLVDSDNDVRNKADQIVQTRTLTMIDLSALKALSKHSRVEGRILVAKYLGKIQTFESSQILSEMATDTAWGVRLQAVKSLEFMLFPEATSTLLERLEDRDNDVLGQALKLLESRRFTAQNLKAMVGLSLSAQWQTRKRAVGLLGKLPGSDSTLALLEKLCDSDEDVRKAAVTESAQRSMGAFEMLTLVQLSERKACAGRKLLPQFLAKGDAALALLGYTVLAKDSDWNVRLAVLQAIETKDDAAFTSLLTGMLGDRDTDVNAKVIAMFKKRNVK